MKTKKQEELVSNYLSELDAETGSLYGEIIRYLSELGYNPVKQKSSISFKHNLHNKQIAKIGRGKTHFFSLRFSACRGYSQRIADIVSAAIVKVTANNPHRLARCLTVECNYCQGEASTHVYTHTYPDGETKTSCGAFAMKIPNMTSEDIPEIRQLIKEEHDYLMEHEAELSVK